VLTVLVILPLPLLADVVVTVRVEMAVVGGGIVVVGAAADTLESVEAFTITVV